MDTPDSFESAFEPLFQKASRVVYRMVRDRAAAEDAAAEALTRAYRHWRRVSQLEHPDAWVMRVAINAALREFRRPPAHSNTEDTPVDHFEDESLERVQVVEILRTLPPRQAASVALRFLADLSQEQVAAILDITAGTVKTHVHRGLNALRQALTVDSDESVIGAPQADWPLWAHSQPWLRDFLALAEREAATRRSNATEVAHFCLALTHDQTGGPALLHELGISIDHWIAHAEQILAGAPTIPPGTSTQWPVTNTETIPVLRAAREDADTCQASVGPGHLLSGIFWHGHPLFSVTRADIRRASGIPHIRRDRPVATSTTPIRPATLPPLLLLGGGTLPTDALDEAYRTAATQRHTPISDLRIGIVFATEAPEATPQSRERLIRRFPGSAFDLGLNTRADAEDDDTIKRIGEADVIYLCGGWSELLHDTLNATSAHHALADAADHGAVLIAYSAGARALGVGSLSSWESMEHPEPLPLLGWLPYIVFPHYLGPPSELAFRRQVEAFAPAQGIALAQNGAVMLHRGWNDLHGFGPSSFTLDQTGALQAIR